MNLEGQICRLRPIRMDDAAQTLGWRLSDRARHLQRGAKTVEEQQKWIEEKSTTSDKNYIIDYMSRSVGMIALYDINLASKSLQMGRFLIGEQDYVGCAPVAFEAELLLSDYAFDDMGMHKIYGDVMEDNHSMLKMRAYLGYQKEGILRDHYIYNGEYKNTTAISILEDEYRSVCRPRLQSLINLFLSQQ